MKRRGTIVGLVTAAALAGCAAHPPPGATPQDEIRLRQELAGLVPGHPIDCLPYGRSSGVTAVGNAVLFRNGTRVWLSRGEGGGCDALESQSYTLVTRSFGSSRLCSGDLGHVVDLTTGTRAGSCILGPFVPYTRP